MTNPLHSSTSIVTPAASHDIEIRLHGRGGQGGVTCAKLLAAIYAGLGRSVQTFGDYAGERSGAPVRAYARVSGRPIENRNKVYRPHHVIVLDTTLLGDDTVAGLATGGLLLVNTPEPPETLAARFGQFRIATVDATGIARRHGIGTRSVVIVNTTIAGAFVRALELPFDELERAYQHLGMASNLPAAREAHGAVQIRASGGSAPGAWTSTSLPPSVLPLEEQHESPPTPLKTGNWRSQTPVYTQNLAPCSAFCPAGNDVVGFVRALATGGDGEAAAVLARTTMLAGVCGRVCAAPCMDGCNRGELDGSVNIRALERWISDHAPAGNGGPAAHPAPRRVAIVGGGPAGLSAAYTLARAGHKVTIYEAEHKLGGLLYTGIPSYRLPREVLDRELSVLAGLSVDVRHGHRLGAAEVRPLPERYDAVILATGLARPQGLKVAGAGLLGVTQGLTFLRRVALGEPSPLHGHVVVLGGGNTALDCARTALRIGADRVTIAYRRDRSDMPAVREEIEQAVEEGIRIVTRVAPVAFEGERHVARVELADVDLGEPDDTGRRRPIVTDRVQSMTCDHVLLALGQSADHGILPPGWELQDGRVHVAGRPIAVFSAGDLHTGDGTVTHAIGDGRRAATRALAALGEEVEVFTRPDRMAAVPITDIRLDHFAPAPPAAEMHRSPETRRRTFGEVSAGLADRLEAHRCFSCGHCTRCDTCLVYCPEGVVRRADMGYAVDYSYCKGCGICVEECPRAAIEMRTT